MAEEQINDFLLDQELEPDDSTSEADLPDDIDAILDAVEDDDSSFMPKSGDADIPSVDAFLGEDEDDEIVTDVDLEKEVNIAAGDFSDDDDIPLMRDIIDPNAPPERHGASSMLTLDDDMMARIMEKIQKVVEQSVNSELGKLTATISENVVSDVKDQLPGVLEKVLKNK